MNAEKVIIDGELLERCTLCQTLFDLDCRADAERCCEGLVNRTDQTIGRVQPNTRRMNVRTMQPEYFDRNETA